MNDLLNKIYKNPKRLVGYYPYPTGGFEFIAETDDSGHKEYDYQLKNFVHLMVLVGALAAERYLDNKTAVAFEVDGIDYLLYAVQYDGRYSICKRVNKEFEERIKIYQNIL